MEIKAMVHWRIESPDPDSDVLLHDEGLAAYQKELDENPRLSKPEWMVEDVDDVRNYGWSAEA